MADKTSTAKILLDFELQKQHLAETRQGVADFNKDVQALGPTALKSGQGVDFLLQRMSDARERSREARDASVDFRAGLLGLDTSLKDASGGTISLTGNLAKAREELERTKQAAVDAAGEIGPSVSQLAGDTSGSDSSAGGVRQGGLFRAGSQLLNQVAPGAGEAVREVGEVTGALSELGPVAIVAGPAVAGVGLILKELTRQADEAHKGLEASLDLQGQYFYLINTGTEQAVKAERDKQLALKKSTEDQIASVKAIQEQIVKIRNSYVGDEGAGSGGPNDPVINGLLEANRQQLVSMGLLTEGQKITAATADDLTAKLTDLGKTADSAGIQADRYTKALDDGTVAANSATAAELQLAAVRKQLTVIGENAADLNQILTLEANGTNTQQVQDLVDAKKLEITTNQYARDASLAYAKTLKEGSDEYNEAIAQADKYGDAISRDRNLIDRITQSTYEIVGARQKEAETLKAVKDFNDQSLKDTDTYLQKKADIEKASGDKIISLANAKADAEEAALSKITDRIASLDLAGDRALEDAKTKEYRAELDALEAAQRVAAKSARDHANNLLDIQRKANEQAESLIATRDFSGLFRLRRDTTLQLQAENTRYDQQTQDQIEALQQQRDDRLKAFARDADDRRVKYNRDVQDANTAYRAELTAAEAKYNKSLALQQQAGTQELSLLEGKYQTEEQLLQQAIQRQLAIINQGNVARALAENATNQGLLAQAAQYGQGNFGSQSGGSGLAGLGNIINNSNRSIGNTTFNIRGNDVAGITSAVHKIVRTQLAYYLG